MTHSLPARRSSDLVALGFADRHQLDFEHQHLIRADLHAGATLAIAEFGRDVELVLRARRHQLHAFGPARDHVVERERSEEHTSELQSLMRISYAVFCLQKKTLTQSIGSLKK